MKEYPINGNHSELSRYESERNSKLLKLIDNFDKTLDKMNKNERLLFSTLWLLMLECNPKQDENNIFSVEITKEIFDVIKNNLREVLNSYN